MRGAGPCDRKAVFKLLMSCLSMDEVLCVTMLAIGAVQNKPRRGRK